MERCAIADPSIFSRHPARHRFEWPNESRRSARYWQEMTDSELKGIGRYLAE
jgi:hypothetical protein